MKKLTTYLTYVALVISSSFAFAGPHHDHADKGKRHIEFLTDKLQLDEAQVEAIKNVFASQKAQATPYHQSMKSLKQALHQELNSDSPDKAKLSELNRQISDNKTELMLIRKQTEKQMNAVLTTEQQAKLEVLKEMRQDKRERRKSRRHSEN
ncbi:Spy/CpxP family protein refolding chaperone [Pleionea litopenaei]|uniref:Signaling pathway modulator ZraP n=1 Tax=Pleionea litopenaei TaxID=3070815 RepID=A0AA51RSD4_9GAMM|nr:Spy/CpxP family protein refolding chaperone [Pleionea sp. HL-JVS1]WMS86614.1 Spy/CpxP family protein refolding chaperone [Pleionea sp. HL-JVS1]